MIEGINLDGSRKVGALRAAGILERRSLLPDPSLPVCLQDPTTSNQTPLATLGDGRGEIVVRLYFVDSPEDETAYRLRISEQAAYFGITPEQTKEVAHEAAAFTAQRLAKPFTVWTRWNSALGRSVLGRVYCIIITAEGSDLNELLVENGLARTYGTRTPMPDGRDSRTYRARLAELEAQAKAAKKGAWRFVK